MTRGLHKRHFILAIYFGFMFEKNQGMIISFFGCDSVVKFWCGIYWANVRFVCPELGHIKQAHEPFDLAFIKSTCEPRSVCSDGGKQRGG